MVPVSRRPGLTATADHRGDPAVFYAAGVVTSDCHGRTCHGEPDLANTISVVIPAFNAADHVAATIASIEAQTRRPDELILVDDGSSDGTADVAAQALAAVPIPSRLIRQANGGVAVARNTGALASHGDFVTFVDADDLLLDDHLASISALLEQHPEAVAAFADVQEFDSDGDRPGTIRSKTLARRAGIAITPAAPGASLLGDGLTAALLLGNFITNSVTVIRRTALSRTGLFDPAFPIGEDRDLYMRLSLLGPFIELERVTARQRRHPASVMATRNNRQWADASLRLLAAFRDRHPELVTDPALRDAFAHARKTWVEIAVFEASRVGLAELRQTTRRCRRLGFAVPPGLRRWLRALSAEIRPRDPGRPGVDLGVAVPRTDNR